MSGAASLTPQQIAAAVANSAPIVVGVSPTGNAAADQVAATAAINKVNAAGFGIVYFNAGLFTPTGPLPPFDPRYVAIQGAGRGVTIIQPTAALTGDLFRAQGAVFGVDQGSSFDGMTIDGVNAAAGACGLHWGDVNGGKLDHLDIRNFAASALLTTPVGIDPTTLSKGLWIDNTRTNLGITERLELGDVRLYANSVNVLMTVKAGMPAANQSFYYQRWKHLQISAQAGQVGVWMKNCLMQGADLNIMANMGATAANSSWFWYLDGSGADHTARVLDAELTIHIETAGAAGTTTYGLFADAGTNLTGQGTFSAYAGTGMTNQSAGAVSLGGQIKLPGIHQSSPINGWNVIAGQATNYTASPWDLVRATASINVLLPLNPVPGQKVALSREGGVTPVFVANTGQTINGAASARMLSSSAVVQSMLVVVALSSTTWRLETAANSDGGLGLVLEGLLNAQGGVGVNVSGPVTAARTLTTTDAMVYCTAGGFPLTFGAALRTGQIIKLINASGTAITFVAAGAGTVSGLATLAANSSAEALVPVAGANPVVFVH